jgi:hypothetical protein
MAMEIGDFFTFKKFVAPFLVKIVFWIGLLFIVLGMLGSLIGVGMIEGYGSIYTGFNIGHALLVLLVGALTILIWRVVCEIWIVLFSIHDRLGELVDLNKKTP